MNYQRVNKIDYYLDIAETVAERSTCLKRHYGAIIVKNDSIVATGFNGAPRGAISCLENNKCYRENSERGMDYSLCTAVHAEQNAIIHSSRDQMIDSDLYLVGIEHESGKYVDNAEPCSLCKRMIINAGIKRVIVRQPETNCKIFEVKDWANDINSIIGGY